jgi:butyryl-CoA dehydrogenase
MFDLSEDHLQIQAMAREFAREEVLPGAQARDQSHAFPSEIIGKMADLGFMGMFIPETYGGSGLDILAYVVALEEICYADAGVGVIMSVQNSLASWPILSFGTEAQKQRYLPDLASGAKIGCYALTEPNAGSDAGSQRTRAVRHEDGSYALTGSKIWITNGPQADVCVTYANLDPEQRHRAVCAFIVESDWDGFAVGKVEEKMGIRCSGTSEIVYENLRVPAENLLHQERRGFEVAMATLDGGRIGIAAQALGIAQRCLDLSVEHARQRIAFGKPIADLQAIQFKLADMKARIEAARLLTWKAAVLKGRGERASMEGSMAKLMASETANFCAYEAVQIHGGYGFSQEYEVERLYRDARITTLYEGTSEIQRVVIAKNLLAG